MGTEVVKKFKAGNICYEITADADLTGRLMYSLFQLGEFKCCRKTLEEAEASVPGEHLPIEEPKSLYSKSQLAKLGELGKVWEKGDKLRFYFGDALVDIIAARKSLSKTKRRMLSLDLSGTYIDLTTGKIAARFDEDRKDLHDIVKEFLEK